MGHKPAMFTVYVQTTLLNTFVKLVSDMDLILLCLPDVSVICVLCSGTLHLFMAIR